MGDVALPDRIAAGDLEAERAAFRSVEQGGEYRGRVEVGEAEPFDAAPVGDERGGAAVADDAVVEVIHGVSCCFSAVLSGIRAAAAAPSGLRRPPFAGRASPRVTSRRKGSTSAWRREVVGGAFGDVAHLDGHGFGRQRTGTCSSSGRVVAEGQDEVVPFGGEEPFDLRAFVQSGDLISTTLSPCMICSLSREQSGAR